MNHSGLQPLADQVSWLTRPFHYATEIYVQMLLQHKNHKIIICPLPVLSHVDILTGVLVASNRPTDDRGQEQESGRALIAYYRLSSREDRAPFTMSMNTFNIQIFHVGLSCSPLALSPEWKGLNVEEWRVSGNQHAGVHVSWVNGGNGGSVTDYSSPVKGRGEARPAAHSSPGLSPLCLTLPKPCDKGACQLPSAAQLHPVPAESTQRLRCLHSYVLG